MKIALRRVVAYVLDYLVIISYVLLLIGASLLIMNIANIEFKERSPLLGQLIGFITLTLPVVLYFYISEKSKYRGTLGKRKMKIEVTKLDTTDLSNSGILLRNIIKFLPWEIAHTGIHWNVHYILNDLVTPNWVWALLIIPQVLVLCYVISIFYSGGTSSIYDNISRTGVVQV